MPIHVALALDERERGSGRVSSDALASAGGDAGGAEGLREASKATSLAEEVVAYPGMSTSIWPQG